MIDIEIDGKTLQVEQGTMIIEAADKAGFNIPRFCYHEKLSIAANCRMCLVEVEKSAKPLPACATPVTPGMKIFTRSPKAIESQRGVMEFLLINHPLDCPICDQGGECELQDLSMGYGRDASRFTEGKRSVADEDLGPLIATEMTRCIQCTRCVRFGQEIAGLPELGAIGRGEDMRISTYVKHSMISEMSGNIIDLCPVGALTSKPFRFTARAWELQQFPSIAPHDCVGSNVYVHTRNQEVMRVVPRENESLNESWLSDRDRFSYLGLNTPDRLQQPMIKRNNQWQETDWLTALNFAVEKIQTLIKKHGPEQIAALASPSATVEEFYLLQKLMRGLGSHNIDHRIRQTDFADQIHAPLYPGMDLPIEEIENQTSILIVGSSVQKEQPILAHRIRQANLAGAKIFCINTMDYRFNFSVAEKIITSPQNMVQSLETILKAITATSNGKLPTALKKLVKSQEVHENEKRLAEQFLKGQSKLILLGALAHQHPQAATIRSLVNTIVKLTQANVGYLTEGVNTAGAWIAGAIPHRKALGEKVSEAGLSAPEALKAKLKAYLLFNIEPELDCADPRLTQQALKQAEIVIAFSPYQANSFLEYADVIFPIAPFTENSGTFVNVSGIKQSFKAVIPCLNETKPGWKILRVLGNIFHFGGFSYQSSEEVRDELFSEKMPPAQYSEWYPTHIEKTSFKLQRITEWPIYAGDSLVRRAEALQRSATNEKIAMRVNSATAKKYQLVQDSEAIVRQGESSVNLPVIIDEKIPEHCIYVPAGVKETSHLGASFAEIEVQHA